MEDIPPPHRVFDRLFYDEPYPQVYGTSHLHDILREEGRQEDQQMLQDMEEDIYQIRRSYLIEHVGFYYDGETVTGWDEATFLNHYRPPTQSTLPAYLSHKLSPQTIERLRPHYEALQHHKDIQHGMDFLKEAFSIKDYVINIVMPQESLFDMRGRKEKRPYSHPTVKKANEVFTDTMDRLDMFVSEHMKRILRRYTSKPENAPSFRLNGPYALLPAGTRLYRGFKQHRGPLNLERGYSYFVMDPASCLIYALPEVDKLNQALNAGSEESHNTLYGKELGGVVEVETTRDIPLWNLSTAENVRLLLAEMKQKNAPQSVLTAFTKCWVVTPNGAFHRASQYSLDMKVIEWMCQNGYNGYMGVQVQGLHDEFVFCNIGEVVRIRKIYGAEDFNLPLCKEPYASLRLNLIYW
jgi:hypothetical protein